MKPSWCGGCEAAVSKHEGFTLHSPTRDEPWTALAPRAELLELLDDALWVGCAARALTWAEILTRLGGEARREHWQSVETWLALYAAGGIDLSG